MKTISKQLILAFLAVALFTACEKERRGGTSPSEPAMVDPSDPDALTKVLVIPGANNVKGNPPAPSSGNSNQPQIGNNQGSASTTANNTLYLPFNFNSFGAGAGYGGCYVQVDGASSYFDIPNGSDTSTGGYIILPLTIPANVGLGSFCLSYCIYDNSGLVSNVLQTCVTIDSSKSCPAFASGNDGLTIVSINLGPDPGKVAIDYDTYSVPDRVDVFYDGNWIGGTGSALAKGEFPPISQCYDNQDGYIGDYGTIEFNYNGKGSGRLDVYMSGCLGGGTAWDVSVSCPQ